jgi:hypothetical protein
MKKPGTLLLLLLVPVISSLAQQKERFDLASFTVPEGWQKVSATAEVVSYAIANNQEGTYCQIGIYRSIGSKGSAQSDFQREWQELIVTTYKPSASAALVPASSRNGWDAQGGAAPFDFSGGQSVAMLVTMSGYSRSMSIVILTNTDGYQPDIESFLDSVEMGTPAVVGSGASGATTGAPDVVQPKAAAPAIKGAFAFTSTNFDDGWVSTVREDWVEASRGSTRVLIHYPNKQADQYNSVVRDGLQTAWNILVAPRYHNIVNLQLKPISGWQTIEFAEADAVEAVTGSPAHVVLFKFDYSNGSGKYMEFITRDKNAFEQEFGPYHETSSGWDKMEEMAYYNRFAIAVSDLKGTWTNDFSSAVQYVNAYTGADAGMATHASNEKFEFGPGNTYKWDLGVASGQVGSIKFQSAKSSGGFPCRATGRQHSRISKASQEPVTPLFPA